MISKWLIAATCLGSGTALAYSASSDPDLCLGPYADTLSALSAQARATDSDPHAKSSYCVRNSVVYECVSYATDGSLRRTRRSARLHGTAFGYRHDLDDTLLLTNQHVAEWPVVTDDEHVVDGVPAGCKKISEILSIVDDDNDDYQPDDVPLVKVVADPQLDVAVLRAHAKLEILPWKIGRSSVLRERNVVEVKGYPLGAFQATNLGKVVSAYDHDDYRDWDHDDFVVDALLSPGNSGSPVLAVSCATGELEIVGIFHAAYSGGSALNVVIGIDQVRDLMTTLKRMPRPHADAPLALDATARTRLSEEVKSGEVFFPFGGMTATVRKRGDCALVFTVLSKSFPLDVTPVLIVEDLAPGNPIDFGAPGRVLIGAGVGLKRYARADLDADAQAQMSKILDALRRAALVTFDWRAAAKNAAVSRDAFERAARLQRTANRTVSRQRDVTQAAGDLVDRLAPSPADPLVGIAELDTSPGT